ncbi:MAG: ABC transporter permease [Candidatus Heimdallarchaeota archaeon]|nr:ABC transporter permease [Candidatus Heimdallarchaeota archaeon]
MASTEEVFERKQTNLKEITPSAEITSEGAFRDNIIVQEKPKKIIKIVHTGLINIKYSIETALVIAKKEILMILRYPWEIMFWTLMPLMWLVPFVFQGQALVGSALQSENFANLAGTTNVLEFIFIGALMWNIVDSAIWGAGNALRWEQHSGTLQYLWLAPISRINLMIGASLGSTIWSLIEIVGQFALLSIFVSWQVTFVDVVVTLLILVLVIIGLYGFSFAFAAVILVFKEPGVFTEFVDSALYICSPVRYPTQVLPNWAKWIAWIIPFSWGLSAIRLLFMTNDSIISMLYMVGILAAIDIIFWIGGYFLFMLAERKTLKQGDLGAF